LHHPLAEISVEWIVAAENNSPSPMQLWSTLKVGSPHRHPQLLDLLTTGDHTAIVVAENGYRHLYQVWPKDSLTGNVEIVAINQR
jgi:hypothetical protein